MYYVWQLTTTMEAKIAKENTNAPVRDDDGPRINENIRVKEVRLIDETGENRGVVSIKEALAAADEANKERAASLYDNQRMQLDNMMTASTMKYLEDTSALSKAKSDSRQRLLMGFSTQFMNRLEDFMNRPSWNNASSGKSNNGGYYFSK